MKVSIENIDSIPIDDYEKRQLKAVLKSDIPEIQRLLKKKFNINEEVYIDWQDFHNEYSPERVDPCPDYYGCYTIHFREETIGVEMTEEELEQNTCSLINLLELL